MYSFFAKRTAGALWGEFFIISPESQGNALLGVLDSHYPMDSGRFCQSAVFKQV